MRRIFYLFFAVTLVLSGCSSLVYKIAVPTATPAPASAQSSNTTPTANPSPQVPVTGVTPTPSANTVDFKIVPGESQVSYTVQETFINKNNKLNTAIGVTKQVTGDIYGNKTDPSQSKIGTITIDISQFTSDSSMRDNFIRKNFLQSNTYPLATFAPTAIDGMPASYTEGQSYSFKVTGNLTVHNITKPVTFDIAASLSGNTLSGTATAGIKMSDFGVGPITLAGMIQTQDDVALTLKFVARPG